MQLLPLIMLASLETVVYARKNNQYLLAQMKESSWSSQALAVIHATMDAVHTNICDKHIAGTAYQAWLLEQS